MKICAVLLGLLLATSPCYAQKHKAAGLVFTGPQRGYKITGRVHGDPYVGRCYLFSGSSNFRCELLVGATGAIVVEGTFTVVNRVITFQSPFAGTIAFSVAQDGTTITVVTNNNIDLTIDSQNIQAVAGGVAISRSEINLQEGATSSQTEPYRPPSAERNAATTTTLGPSTTSTTLSVPTSSTIVTPSSTTTTVTSSTTPITVVTP